MQKYIKPEIEVTMFTAKEAVTDTYDGVSQTNKPSPFGY